MLAIHHRSGSFSDKWIEYCILNKVPYKLVDCYRSDIVEQIKNCDGLMWHWAHYDHKAVLFARQLIYSLEKMGKKVFPNAHTSWHYDDKVGQKYLLEAVAAPLVPSYVFYDKREALDWAKKTTYPKVFKLRGGAGSQNVQIVLNLLAANKLINKAFGGGFNAFNRRYFLTERLGQFRRDKTVTSFFNIGKGLGRLFIPTKQEKYFSRERNYIYFQEFIPENNFDIRINVIGNRAFGFKRMVRQGDFRASGSGKLIHDPNQIPIDCLQIALDLSVRIQSQSIAFDFVFNSGKPLLVEVSYCFPPRFYLLCPGYWNERLEWIGGPFTPEYFIIKDFLMQSDTI